MMATHIWHPAPFRPDPRFESHTFSNTPQAADVDARLSSRRGAAPGKSIGAGSVKRMATVSRPSDSRRPEITYIDLTDATNDAIGMTGRFMRGRPREIVALTLGVGGCFYVALYS